MAKSEDGGAAFPVVTNVDSGLIESSGMTLRDYFAGKALAGLLSDPTVLMRNDGETGPQAYARMSYEMADAMLKARR